MHSLQVIGSLKDTSYFFIRHASYEIVYILVTHLQSWALATIFAATRQCREGEKLSLVELSLNI